MRGAILGGRKMWKGCRLTWAL